MRSLMAQLKVELKMPAPERVALHGLTEVKAECNSGTGRRSPMNRRDQDRNRKLPICHHENTA